MQESLIVYSKLLELAIVDLYMVGPTQEHNVILTDDGYLVSGETRIRIKQYIKTEKHGVLAQLEDDTLVSIEIASNDQQVGPDHLPSRQMSFLDNNYNELSKLVYDAGKQDEYCLIFGGKIIHSGTKEEMEKIKGSVNIMFLEWKPPAN